MVEAKGGGGVGGKDCTQGKHSSEIISSICTSFYSFTPMFVKMRVKRDKKKNT